MDIDLVSDERLLSYRAWKDELGRGMEMDGHVNQLCKYRTGSDIYRDAHRKFRANTVPTRIVAEMPIKNQGVSPGFLI